MTGDMTTLPTSLSLLGAADVEPWEHLEEIRNVGDIVWDDSMNAWLVSSHELIREIGRSDGTDWHSPFVPDPDDPPYGMSPEDYVFYMGHGSPRAIMLLEGEEHRLLHRWWTRTFSLKVANMWREDVIRNVAEITVDRFAAEGKAELWSDYAERVGSRVIAAVMGFPWQDEEWFDRLFELATIRFLFKQEVANRDHDPAVLAGVFDATTELKEMLTPIVLSRRSGTGDDFVSMIWQEAPELFGETYEDDAVALAIGAFESAAMTTQYSTSNGVYLLLKQPELQEEIRSGDETLLANFVEESLRLYGPVLPRLRIAKRDLELGGTSIRKGDWVIALMLAGSRDPAHYDRPHEVVLDRATPRDHFSFWVGPKTCPGATLARVELAEAASVLVRRLRDLRFDPEAEPPRYDQLVFRRWAPLHAVWTT
jgi:cytochrome P450